MNEWINEWITILWGRLYGRRGGGGGRRKLYQDEDELVDENEIAKRTIPFTGMLKIFLWNGNRASKVNKWINK